MTENTLLLYCNHAACRDGPEIDTRTLVPEAEALDISPLVYSICDQRKLPVLVTDNIARYLDKHDILEINFTSA